MCAKAITLSDKILLFFEELFKQSCGEYIGQVIGAAAAAMFLMKLVLSG